MHHARRVSWTLYGVIVTQLGDYTDRQIILIDGTTQSVPDYLESAYNYKCPHTHPPPPPRRFLLHDGSWTLDLCPRGQSPDHNASQSPDHNARPKLKRRVNHESCAMAMELESLLG